MPSYEDLSGLTREELGRLGDEAQRAGDTRLLWAIAAELLRRAAPEARKVLAGHRARWDRRR